MWIELKYIAQGCNYNYNKSKMFEIENIISTIPCALSTSKYVENKNDKKEYYFDFNCK